MKIVNKDFYRLQDNVKIEQVLEGLPAIVEISVINKILEVPFDEVMTDCMEIAMSRVCNDLTNVSFAYRTSNTVAFYCTEVSEVLAKY